MADIELVIKIPEEIYKASQIIDVKYEDVIQIPLEVFKNGIPLPKGYGRLIDADALEEEIRHAWTIGACYRFIENAPTILEADKAESEE